MRRFVLPKPVIGIDSLVLEGHDHHYLAHVLRCARGDSFIGIDPSGIEVRCTVEKITATSCEVKIEAGRENTVGRREAVEPVITLFQCLPKGNKIDQIIRQATECGVTKIVPVRSRFVVGDVPTDRLDRRIDRWRRIAREAVQQSGAESPTIEVPVSLAEIPTVWNGRGDALIFHQDCLDTSQFLDTLSLSSGEIAICIGPEGGFAPDEVDMLSAEGFVPVYLGKRVLRTETAAIYAIAAVQMCGRFRSREFEHSDREFHI